MGEIILDVPGVGPTKFPDEGTATKFMQSRASSGGMSSRSSVSAPSRPAVRPAISPQTEQYIRAAGGDPENAKLLFEMDKVQSDKTQAKEEDQLANVDGAISKLGIVGDLFKRMQNQGAVSTDTLSPGNLRGVLNKVEGALKTNPAATAYDPNTTEMAATQAKLVTNSGRPGEKVTQGIKESIPNGFDTYQSFANKISTQLLNDYASKAAQTHQPFDPDAYQQKINESLKRYMPADEHAVFVKSLATTPPSSRPLPQEGFPQQSGVATMDRPHQNLSDAELKQKLGI